MPQAAQKPFWLNKKIKLDDCQRMEILLGGLNLNTVCHKALCPNIGECFSRGEAAFLILGNICTRDCKFCSVPKGKPAGIDVDEPRRVAEAVKKLNLKHVVITSVTRDDLPDGGSGIFAETVLRIRQKLPQSSIEILIPDFQGDEKAINNVVKVKPDIIGHNLETVPRLYKEVRQGASYERSLEVLAIIKNIDYNMYTKSGLMLGMGEEQRELLDVFSDLGKVKCDFLSLGQYLSGGPNQYPVQEYLSPQVFDDFKEKALNYGFKFVISGPYVRSSYRAEEYCKNDTGN
jgi:lipoic acid synthetase